MFIFYHCISGDGVEDDLRDMTRNQVCANESFVLCDRCTSTKSIKKSDMVMKIAI